VFLFPDVLCEIRDPLFAHAVTTPASGRFRSTCLRDGCCWLDEKEAGKAAWDGVRINCLVG
jgi:hypothetical protein